MYERNTQTGIALKHFISVSWITPQQQPVRQQSIPYLKGIPRGCCKLYVSFRFFSSFLLFSV